MMGFIEEMLLKNEGLSDQDVTDLNTILPDIQALDIALAAQIPRITKVAPIILRIVNTIIAKQRSLG